MKYTILFTIVSLIFGSTVFAQTEKPNFLIIQVDDMGYDDLSINGNTVSHTPTLDAFSQEAVRFSNFMVNSVCAPTRASMLTGRDFWKTGVSAMHGGRDFLNLDETTFADVFQQNGYTTGMWGKWHSGKADGYWPWDRGFDEAYYAELYHYNPSNGWHNEYPKKTTHTGKWSAEVLVDYTIDFIDRKKNEPFLAYLSFLTCHDTWAAPEEYIAKYREEGRTERFATLLAMLEYMDVQVARLFDYMDKNGLTENTIILFMSDNGPNVSGANATEWSLRNNHGYLGNKARLWQNGIKSPLYVQHGDKYTPTDVERLVTVTDIFPTLLDLAGIDIPADNKDIDGRSFKPYLEGDYTSLDTKKAIHAHWNPIWDKDQFQPVSKEVREGLSFDKQRITMLTDDYKLLFNPVNVNGSPTKSSNLVFVDLKNDPMETTNASIFFSTEVSELKTELKNWFEEIKKTEGAFSAPEFQIAWQGKTESEIVAYGPSKVIGALNETHELLEFNEVGNQIEYQINVHNQGIYEITVVTKKSKLDTYELEVSCDGQSVKKKLSTPLTQKIGSIGLKEGKSTLTLKITDKEVTDKTGFGEFNLIKLKRVGDYDYSSSTNLGFNHELKLYPNPANSGLLHLECHDHFKGLEYQIIDVNGRVLQTGNVTEAISKGVDLSNMNSGLYHFLIYGGNGIVSKKFII